MNFQFQEKKNKRIQISRNQFLEEMILWRIFIISICLLNIQSPYPYLEYWILRSERFIQPEELVLFIGSLMRGNWVGNPADVLGLFRILSGFFWTGKRWKVQGPSTYVMWVKRGSWSSVNWRFGKGRRDGKRNKDNSDRGPSEGIFTAAKSQRWKGMCTGCWGIWVSASKETK